MTTNTQDYCRTLTSTIKMMDMHSITFNFGIANLANSSFCHGVKSYCLKSFPSSIISGFIFTFERAKSMSYGTRFKFLRTCYAISLFRSFVLLKSKLFEFCCTVPAPSCLNTIFVAFYRSNFPTYRAYGLISFWVFVFLLLTSDIGASPRAVFLMCNVAWLWGHFLFANQTIFNQLVYHCFYHSYHYN